MLKKILFLPFCFLFIFSTFTYSQSYRDMLTQEEIEKVLEIANVFQQEFDELSEEEKEVVREGVLNLFKDLPLEEKVNFIDVPFKLMFFIGTTATGGALAIAFSVGVATGVAVTGSLACGGITLASLLGYHYYINQAKNE